jgi:DNA-directed RNA polymerase alpha subunit
MNAQETQISHLFKAWVKEAIRFGNFELQKEVDDLLAHAKEGWALAGDRLNKIKELEQIIARKKADEDYAARPVKEPLTPISYLKLPRKVRTVLENQGFQSIGDIIDNTELKMLKMRNLGKGGLAILKAELARHGKTLSRLTK